MFKSFKDYSLFKQLLIPVFIVGAFSILASLYSANKLEKSLIKLEEIYIFQERDRRLLEEIEAAMSHYRSLSLHHLSYESNLLMDKASKQLNQTKEKLQNKIKLIYRHSSTNEIVIIEKTQLLSNLMDKYFSIINDVITLSADFEKELAFETLRKAEDAFLPEINNLLTLLKNHHFEELALSRKDLKAVTEHNLYMTFMAAILGGAFFILTAYLVTQGIVKRLDNILNWSKKVSTGNYSAEIDLCYDDEVGRLSKAMSEMAFKIKHAHSELATSKEHAELANRSKSEFLAMMSHEIRTPMNAVLGMNALALETELPEKTRNYIDKAYLSAETLLGIINDILDFSKIEAGQMQLDYISFNLNTFLKKLDFILSHKAHEKELELIFDIDPDIPLCLYGDPMRLNQILLNLGNNAIKFTEEGNITLRVQLLHKSTIDVKLKFQVIDTGLGIEKEKQKQLFQPFIQADNSISRQHGGTGLGLVISKRLAEMMDGQISLESELKKGSTFSFTAIIQIDKKSKPIEYIVNEKAIMARILVVDDNKNSRHVLISLLIKFGFNVDGAASGLEALEKIQSAENEKVRYKLILMDVFMPELNGIDTVMKIQQLILTNIKPKIVMMLTTYDSEALYDQIESLVPDALLIKPVTPSSLLDAIHTSLGFQRASQQIHAFKKINYADADKLLNGSCILLVEDNVLNQELAIELLNKVGIKIMLAENGKQALDILSKEKFDGVLMDIQMPIMDGLTATKMIRQQECFKNLPIIAMTANTMVGDREKALAVGMNDHISKPINFKKMIYTMIKWIKPELAIEQVVSKKIEQPIADKNNEAEEGESSQLKPLDTELGTKLCGGNPDFYNKMLHKFADLHKSFIIEFTQAINDNELSTRIVHSLKSSAGNIGAQKLQAVSLELEKMCRNQASNETIKNKLIKVEKELNELIELIQQN